MEAGEATFLLSSALGAGRGRGAGGRKGAAGTQAAGEPGFRGECFCESAPSAAGGLSPPAVLCQGLAAVVACLPVWPLMTCISARACFLFCCCPEGSRCFCSGTGVLVLKRGREREEYVRTSIVSLARLDVRCYRVCGACFFCAVLFYDIALGYVCEGSMRILVPAAIFSSTRPGDSPFTRYLTLYVDSYNSSCF